MMDNMLLIDGNSLLNRAYYGLPPLNNARGEATHAVYGFTMMLIKVIQEYKPTYIAVAFDLPHPTFRHKLYVDYKAGRRKMPDDLASQFPILKQQLSLMNIAIIEKQGYEADDIIGTLSKTDGVMKYIVTGDRDSLQLISDTTHVVLTKRGITDTVVVDEARLKQDFSLTPSQVIDYKALAGDSSDNIPGVPKIGEKTAISLLDKYGDLDGVLAHKDEISGKMGENIRGNVDSALMSRTLATIDCAVPIEITLDEMKYTYPFAPAVRTFFKENAFASLLKREELFATGDSESVDITAQTFTAKLLTSTDEVVSTLTGVNTLSVNVGERITFAIGDDVEYEIAVKKTLIDEGMDYITAIKSLSNILADNNVKKVIFDVKTLQNPLDAYQMPINNYDDIKLMQFIVDMRVPIDTATQLVDHYNYDVTAPSCAILALYARLMEQLNADEQLKKLYYDVELPLIAVLYRMEKRGVKIDVNFLAELSKIYTEREKQVTKRIYEVAGKEFNLHSPKQLATVLFEDLTIPYPKKSKKYSTSAEILEQIKDKHEIVPLILEYRTITKINSAYVEGFAKLLNGNDVIHTDYKQMLTTTGRLSSAEPNLQNLPIRTEEGRTLRGLFVAREGCSYVSADYSQIELRLVAHFSGDDKMIELYHSGDDIHARTAAEVFGVPLGEVTKEMRRDAKTVNFGIIYGMSEFGLAQNLGCSILTARQYMQTYFQRFSKVKPYFESIVTAAKECGFTRSLLGRKRYIPELASSNAILRQFGERAAMNMPLQGSAADIIKLAMIELDEKLKDKKSKLILQIHDELIIEATDDEVEEMKLLIKQCMENAVKLSVPLPVEVESGKSWLEC